MTSKPVDLQLTVESLYSYDIYFEPGSEEKDRTPIRGKMYDSPLHIGEELPAWWTNNTYVITRIERHEAGDTQKVMVRPTTNKEIGKP